MNGDILFLAHRVPYPPDRGDKMRSYHLLRRLSELARVHLATFADDDADVANAEALRPLVGRLHVEKRVGTASSAALGALVRGRPISVAAFDSAEMHAAVRAMLGDRPIDTIFAFSGQMAQFVPAGPHRFVMDFVDVDSAKFAAYAERGFAPMRRLHAREAALLGRYERAAAERADLSLFVSDAEAQLFRDFNSLRPDAVATLENGIDLEHYSPGAAFAPLAGSQRGQGPLIVFTGQMDYRPNIEAAAGFATTVLPAIRARHRDARFAIVGRKPPPSLVRMSGEGGVQVTGAVADVRSWLAAADIVVAPLVIARGMQNKVLEGMAMARPVIASPAAFAGLDAQPGRDLIVAEVGVMASSILDLLDRPERARELGRAARQLVERRYGWEAQLRPLAAIVGRAHDPALGAAA